MPLINEYQIKGASQNFTRIQEENTFERNKIRVPVQIQNSRVIQQINYENPSTIQLNIARNLSQQQMRSSAFYQPPIFLNGNNNANYPATN